MTLEAMLDVDFGQVTGVQSGLGMASGETTIDVTRRWVRDRRR